MNKNVIIIDDDETLAANLSKALKAKYSDVGFDYASEESDIINKVISKSFSIAIVDIRMDGYDIDGLKVVDLISEVNPFAKVIAISAYTKEYWDVLNDYLKSGKILAISEKESYDIWIPKLTKIIDGYFGKNDEPIAVRILDNAFAMAKNEIDTYRKGVMFEEFVVGLFRQMGFYHIETRKKDSSSNEIDIIVRNDVKDPLFEKFGRYIFVECKNKPEDGFSKNDFIVFNNKINSSAGDCDLGVVFTTGIIKRTVPKEVLKESKFKTKILFMSSSEILRLIHTPNMIEEFKNIIDEQVV